MIRTTVHTKNKVEILTVCSEHIITPILQGITGEYPNVCASMEAHKIVTKHEITSGMLITLLHDPRYDEEFRASMLLNLAMATAEAILHETNTNTVLVVGEKNHYWYDKEE